MGRKNASGWQCARSQRWRFADVNFYFAKQRVGLRATGKFE